MPRTGYYASCVVFTLLISCLMILIVDAKDVFASSAHLKQLADGEKHLVATLRQYIADEQTRLDQIDSLLSSVREIHQQATSMSSSSAKMSDHLTANPLHAFHLIKRFATTWRQIWNLASNFTAFEGLKESSDKLVDHLPDDADVNSAMWSLVRLRSTYDLQINDLMRGHVMGYEAPPLDQHLPFQLALMCLGNGEPDEAIKWLTHAYKATSGVRNPAETEPLSVIYQALGRAYAQKQDYVMAVSYIHKAIQLDPLNGGLLVDILPPSNIRPTSQAEELAWKGNYFELCRKAANPESQYHVEVSRDSSSGLYCELQRSRVVPFKHFKVEYLHRSPQIVLFHEFLANRESEKLIELAVSQIIRAKVGSTMESVESEVRVGKVAWLYDDKDDPIVRVVSQRIADVTGLNTTFPTGEPLQRCENNTTQIASVDATIRRNTRKKQLVFVDHTPEYIRQTTTMSNYGIGGHYEPHYDHDERRFEQEKQSPEVIENGDRMATFMIYLNDVTVGGATAFTKLNVATKPVKNAAIFWYNYRHCGEMEPLSLHAACPVVIGEKWVANKWIREHGQEFARPCLSNEVITA